MEAVIDDVLEILAGTGPEFGQGYSNHGPMAAEAMIKLGRGEKVIAWTERYKKRLHPHPQPKQEIPEHDWQAALGMRDRIGDWIVFFRKELRENPWKNVIELWAPRLAPGMMAGGTHGIIRTGHAVRSLTAGETVMRLNELAEGLGYWAALFGRLPGRRDHPIGDLRPAQAIERVPVVSKEELRKYHLIQESMEDLKLVPEFAETVNRIDVHGDPSKFLSMLTETTAACYLANGENITHVITFIHSVTSPSMLRMLLPYIKADDVETVLSYAWQTCMGLYATHGQSGMQASCEETQFDQEELIDRAVGTQDEHAIKFTEACLREFGMNQKTVYLDAACHAYRVIGKDPVSPTTARC